MTEPTYADGTGVTIGELQQIGATVLNVVSAVAQMGHDSPASTLDYWTMTPQTIPEAIVRDFVAWTSGRTDLVPGCEQRMRDLVATTGWTSSGAARIGAYIAPKTP